MSAESVKIVLVEDDVVDAENVRRTLRRLRVSNPVHTYPDGARALVALRGNGAAPLARPYVILLDLNMPRMNGFEFLAQLAGDARLRDSVVFVLTTSDAPVDRARAGAHGVAGYIVKSEVGEELSQVTPMLDPSWHACARRPEPGAR